MLAVHSSTSEQEVPLPVKPELHEQVKPPVVLVQVELASQSSVLAVHSLMSEQEVPLPVKPELHEQVKPPLVLVQVALASQSSVLAVHSLMSTQVPDEQSQPSSTVHVDEQPSLSSVSPSSQASPLETVPSPHWLTSEQEVGQFDPEQMPTPPVFMFSQAFPRCRCVSTGK